MKPVGYCIPCNTGYQYLGECPDCGATMKVVRGRRKPDTRVLVRDAHMRDVDFHETRSGYPLGLDYPMGSTFSWLKVLRADPCAYCGRLPSETVDHVVPTNPDVPNTKTVCAMNAAVLSKTTWLNLVGACASCNTGKSSTLMLWFVGGIRAPADAGAEGEIVPDRLAA